MAGLGVATCAAIMLAWTAPAMAKPFKVALGDLANTHPDIDRASHRMQVAGANIGRAQSAFYPQLNLTADAGYENIDQTDTILGTDSSLTRRRAELQARYTLFDADERSARLRAARHAHNFAGLRKNSTIQKLMLEGITAYIDVMKSQALVALSQVSEQNIAQQLKLEDERVERGVGIELDVLFAKARLQQAKERSTALRGTLANAIARYQEIFSHVPNVGAMTVPEVPAGALPRDVEDAINRAKVENVEIRAAEVSALSAEEQITIARADYFPKLDIVGRAAYEQDVEAREGTRKDAAITAEVNWALFRGFDSRNAETAARYTHAASLSEVSSLERQAERNAITAWNEWNTAKKRQSLLQNAVNLVSEVHQARIKQRDAGRETALNVLDAESETFTQRINLAGAQFDRKVSAFNLLFVTGQLTPENIQSLNFGQ
ncbi:MAG: TolC family protein [Alphaproteobacteria bacterium]